MGLPLSRCCLAPLRKAVPDMDLASYVCTKCEHAADPRTPEQARERARAQTRAGWARFIERHRERNRIYYAQNRERLCSRARARYHNDPAHKQRVLEREAQRRKKRKENEA